METHELTREQLIEMLSDSPCHKPGHRRCDWVEHLPHQSWPDYCEACVRERKREEAIAAAERERCIGVCRSVKNGEWAKSSLCIEDTIAKVIRSLGKEPAK